MKSRRSVFAAVIVILAIVAVACIACNKTEELRESGDEAGLYYCIADSGECELMLGSESKFTLHIGEDFRSGSYELDGTSLVMTFNKKEDGSLDAYYSNDSVLLAYNGVQYNFVRKTTYTVTFEPNGGSAVDAESVYNGRQVRRPANPTFDGHIFLGWYTDEQCTTSYLFTEPVTKNFTLYARWALATPGESEYTVKFDAGDSTLPKIADMTTVSGRLYEVPAPAQRQGYVFGGWWVSMFDSGSKLTYMYDQDTVFEENTTLFAFWEPAQTTFAMPSVQIRENGVFWNTVQGATYELTISTPSGRTVSETNIVAATDHYDYSFTEKGEYSVEFKATVGGESKSVRRYYNGMALKRVSLFTVVGSDFIFNHVNNAESYVISLICGDEGHDHENVNIGGVNTFSFANCPMREDGLQFTVTAMAEGYISSTSQTFVYRRALDKIPEDGLTDDPSTETVSWERVPFATSYEVGVICQNTAHHHTSVNIGNASSYSYKECSGNIVIEVKPVAKGYFEPEATRIEINKTRLAAPSNIQIIGNTVTWDAVEGATSYEVSIDGVVKTAYPTAGESTVSFKLDSAISEWDVSKVYILTVKARGNGNDSLETDGIPLMYNVMSDTLKYSGNVLSWKHVIGAEYYEITVNDTILGDQPDEYKGMSFIELELPNAGENTISVRASLGGSRFTTAATIKVFAHTVTLMDGDEEYKVMYKAAGDILDLPTPEKDLMNFVGWYNLPGGAAENGLKFESGIFGENCDITLYAQWEYKTYNVNLDFGTQEVEDDTPEVDTLSYGGNNQVLAPVAKDKTWVFLGWYIGDTKITDAYGKCIDETQLEADATLTARWLQALEFDIPQNSQRCSVSASQGLKASTEAKVVTIPEYYNDLPVTAVDDFQNCASIEELNIPDTVSSISISTGVFSGCTALRKIEIYETGHALNRNYDSVDGMLVTLSGATRQLLFCPDSVPDKFTIPSGINELGRAVFENKQFSEVTIPASVTMIRNLAFGGCNRLTSVVFAEGADALTIEDNAFANCTQLRAVNLPIRTKVVTAASFVGCNNLTDLTATPGASFENRDGVLFGLTNKVMTSLVFFPQTKVPEGVENGKRVQNKYIVPSTVTEIGINAFYGNKNLKEITLPEGLKVIGSNAFNGTALIGVAFPASIQSIGDSAFRGLSGLSEVTFADECVLNSIGSWAFASCPMIENVVLPDGVTSLGAGAFNHCTGLQTISLGNSLSAIADQTFEGSGLVAVAIPASVVSIGEKTFFECRMLRDLTFAEEKSALTTIGKNAFASTISLKKVKLPEGLITLENNVFDGSGIEFIDLPDSLVNFGHYALSTASLKKVIVGKNNYTFIGESGYCNADMVCYRGTTVGECKVDVSRFGRNAKLYVFSAATPTERGNFWHYDGSGVPVAW